MEKANDLGDYLKARRRLVTPEQAGIPRGARRRVVGLRREEVAVLAGISPEYYLRLEQGRDRNPSPSVLDAIARVLRLTEEGFQYLRELAAPPHSGARSGGGEEHVPEGVGLLVGGLSVPTFVQGRWMDVLASNAPARALSPHYRPGVNLLRAVFSDPAEQILHQDWDRATEEAVSGLRASAGADLGNPHLLDLVAELSERSGRFRALWDRQDIRQKVGGVSRYLHPLVGAMELRHEKFFVTGAVGQIMVMYHADPGSPSDKALRRLASGQAMSEVTSL